MCLASHQTNQRQSSSYPALESKGSWRHPRPTSQWYPHKMPLAAEPPCTPWVWRISYPRWCKRPMIQRDLNAPMKMKRRKRCRQTEIALQVDPRFAMQWCREQKSRCQKTRRGKSSNAKVPALEGSSILPLATFLLRFIIPFIFPPSTGHPHSKPFNPLLILLLFWLLLCNKYFFNDFRFFFLLFFYI